MMFRLRARIAAEGLSQPAISAAVGMQLQDHTPRSVQPHRQADLFQHEFAVALTVGRGQALGAAGNLDGIGVNHADPLEKLPEPKFKPVIEEPDDGRIAVILFAWGIEVEHFFHGAPSYPTLSPPTPLHSNQCAIS